MLFYATTVFFKLIEIAWGFMFSLTGYSVSKRDFSSSNS